MKVRRLKNGSICNQFRIMTFIITKQCIFSTKYLFIHFLNKIVFVSSIAQDILYNIYTINTKSITEQHYLVIFFIRKNPNFIKIPYQSQVVQFSVMYKCI